MAIDATPDIGTETQAAARTSEPLQLSIHVVFEQLPIATYPDDGSGEAAVKYGPPFVRFPVNLTAEDATVLENIFGSADVAMIAFEVKKGDGSPRFYRAIMAR